MGKKKNATTSTTPTGLPALKIGSRVRCTDDGVTGRIVWANAVAVKVKWDDGEQVTWKRDSLATRPIEILDTDADAVAEPQVLPLPERAEVPEATPAVGQAAEAEPAPADGEEQHVQTAAVPEAPAEVAGASPVTSGQAESPAAPTGADHQPEAPAPAETKPAAADQPQVQTPAPEATPAKPKRQRKAKAPAEPKERKVSALDAAARVLTEAGQAMTCKEMIGAMAAKGYWSSPGGQTPDATLYSAILREIATKSDQARFAKAAPGRFTRRPTA
jgi:hypothetical protein